MGKSDKNGKNSDAVHFILQGKGGVGKSLVAAFLAQYFLEDEGAIVKCRDTDPVNQTLISYKALQASHINLMEGSKIDERNFDALMEQLLSERGTFVVDNGSSSFIPMSNYLIENDAIGMLHEAGREVFIHCVVTGGQALVDTLTGFKALSEQSKSRNIVVWLNEYYGAIEREGKVFEEMRVYVENADKVRGIVRLVKRNPDTFGKDVERMIGAKQTFKEALTGGEFTIMAMRRLNIVKTELFSQLGDIGF